MRQCLTSPEGGYYTSKIEGRDQFGKTGDFITSPEISQVFGELVGIWIVAEWMAQGKKSSGVSIIEVGPGRGTLMDDMLRTIQNFKPLASAIEAIYLVEASESLRSAQKQLLCGDAAMEQTTLGFQSKSKYGGLPVIWLDDVRQIPKDPESTPFIVAHEFFDALPIHAFQSVPPPKEESSITTSVSSPSPSPPRRLPNSRSKTNQWRELLVSPTPPPSSNILRTFSRPSAAPSSPLSKEQEGAEFQLTLSPAPTPHSIYLPTLSQRYAALLPQTGSTIEISPESLSIAGHIATLIGGSAPPNPSTPSSPVSSKTTQAFTKPHPSGAALVIDYGPSSTIPTNTLRGIRNHARVNPFSAAGLVDLSADVDFTGLAEAAINASEGVEVHGPVEQALWLQSLGGEQRVEQLTRGSEGQGGMGGGDVGSVKERKERIEGAWRRLVDRGVNGMGRLYKVMAIVPYVPKREGRKRRPVGFGGDVVG